MGFLKDLLFGDPCENCGSHSLAKVSEFLESEGIYIRECRACGCISMYGRIPSCHRCGGKCTTIDQNRYGVWVPACPECGFIWDGD